MSKKFLKGARVFTVTGQTYDGGDILIDGGKIAAVGVGLTAPDDADTLDMSGMTITPGLIDAHTHIGSSTQGYPMEMRDTNERSDPLTPYLRILDAINPDDEAFENSLSGGVTCVQTLPGSANIIGGAGAIIKTKPDVVEKMVVREPSCMKAAFGENPIRVYGGRSKAPNTRMGAAYLMRSAFVKAMNYAAKREAAERKGEPFERDLGSEALCRVLNRSMPLSVHCHRADDIQTAVRVAEEFKIEFTIEHCTEGHLIAPWLAQKGVRAAVGPTFGGKSKPELANKTWETLKVLSDAGVHFCMITDHSVDPIEYLHVLASLAVRAGLPESQALKAITIYGAEHIGMNGSIGSIEPGKDADLAVWDGDPLCSRTSCCATFIDGELVFEKK